MKKEPGMAYNMKTLNKVFAALSIIFFIAVIWMFLDDYIRPWKAVQIKGMEIERDVTQAKLNELDKNLDKEEVEKIKAEIDEAKAKLTDNQKVINDLEAKLGNVQKKIYVQNMDNGIYSAQSGEYQFKYEHAVKFDHMNDAKKYKKSLDKYRALFAEGKDQLKTFQAQEVSITKELKTIREEKTELEKTLTKLVGTKNRTLASLKKTERDPIWFLRNAPFIDFLDPTIKIQQIVVDKALDDRYFVKVPRVDRCTTCHLFIDKKGFEEQANPYKTHPNIDELAVGLNSAHPYKEFGCTSCHGGEGHRVFDFNSPAHMPDSDEKEQMWVEKHHFHEPHKIPSPMMPLKYTESQCLKCHTDVQRVPMATKLNKGRELIEQYGCYACHKIKGWEHLKKPAPMLTKIKSKIPSKEFIKNWIWSPHSFNPNSKMPAFFMQSNNSAPKHAKKNIAEVNAMAEYLWEKSETYKPFLKYRGGDVENGKQLIQTVGCVACHKVKGLDDNYAKVDSEKGPWLDGLASKVDKDWLVSWLKKPSHYSKETIMPSFRLSDKEANDIAAYLLSFENKNFANLEFEDLDKATRDDLLLEYFSAFEPMSMAKAKLEKMSDKERTMELGYRSIGKYGCYSCHTIAGFKPDRAPIGPELTNEGSKPIHQFGHGIQTDVKHRREDWIFKHLKNPRRWDIGIPKPFKDLTRMPNFYLTDKETELITLAILGQVSDPIPLKGQRRLTANEKLAEKGKRVVEKYNCQGCHKIDGMGGDLLKAMDDDASEGPPYLVNQGHRVDSAWFYKFLKEVHPIRPWVKVRMPSFNFSNDEINAIVEYFRANANEVNFSEENESWSWEPGEREAAKKIFNELACTSCHTGGFNQDEAQGPDLHYVKRRLRFSWVEKWLWNPQAILPYTAMPSFWDGGKEVAVPGVLGDDPKRQIRALTKYLMEMGYDRDPVPFRKD